MCIGDIIIEIEAITSQAMCFDSTLSQSSEHLRFDSAFTIGELVAYKSNLPDHKLSVILH